MALDTEMLDLEEGIVMLPASIQKDYPNDNSPEYTEIALADDTIRTLRTYLSNRWKDSPALFPSRQSDRMTRQSAGNVVSDAAEAAEVRPYTTEGRGKPSRTHCGTRSLTGCSIEKRGIRYTT
jgi:integrase/recombinase XerC/integrase/recombinase XerD